MLFNSYTFCVLFLPLCLGLFALCLRLGDRAVCLGLLAASVGFYAWWNPGHVPLLIGSIVGNYLCGLGIARCGTAGRTRAASWLTGLGVAGNLALLGWFKYAGFFAEAAGGAAGFSAAFGTIALPLAISFFTFQQVAFLIDVRRDPANLSGPLHYALFVAFFPQLIAGPIVAHRDLAPQFKTGWGGRFPWERAAAGLTLFAVGLIKKVFFADPVGGIADAVFARADAGFGLTTWEAWAGTLAYGLQLYYDFSGYSDMAVGLGGLFGVALPRNFDAPYRSRDIGEFWRRWHITLGAFFREYLYFPLGGSRRGELRTTANLLATMLLCGLWHGAGWAFIVWGGVHGAALVVCRLWKRVGRPLPGPAAWAVTFLFVTLAWVPFRAAALEPAGRVYRALAGYGTTAGFGATLHNLPMPTEPAAKLKQLPLLAALLFAVLVLPEGYRWVYGDGTAADTGMGDAPAVGPGPRWWEWRPSPAYASLTGAMLFLVLLNLNRLSAFLYFNF